MCVSVITLICYTNIITPTFNHTHRMHKKEFSTVIGGKTLTATFSDLAERANGSVLIRYGNTVILATAVMSQYQKEGGDFFPLTVDFEEKFYASGRILGSRYVRREGKPSDEAILSGRIVDRTIRPLFYQWIRNEVQVIITVLSIDEDDPDILGVLGASLALGTSDIPWNGPVSAVRIVKMKDSGHLIVNPTYVIRDGASPEFELVACGKDGNITMIELGGNETTEDAVNEALEEASKVIEDIQVFQKKVIAEIGKQKKVLPKPMLPEGLEALWQKDIVPICESYIFSGLPGDGKIHELLSIWKEKMATALPDVSPHSAESLFEEKVNELVHTHAIEKERRADGRKIDEIRPLFAQAGGVSPTLHGSGIFYRGGTHILSVLTLGGPKDAQLIEGMEESDNKRFMHHYNFPPFSTGETGRAGSTNRRMIGHGALAEKALLPIIPDRSAFPYTILIVSEALSSNGSTSMASVCGSTLALMDGGVPIKKPVAGIASGLMLSKAKSTFGGIKYKYKILTDIQGPEDHYGDMDFKVAGTKDGITAIQMDIKVGSIPLSILSEAFEKAKIARLKILEVIVSAIASPRADISAKAPKIIVLHIRPDQIGGVIGSGGKVINEIKDSTRVDAIDIEDDGTIFITGKDGTAEKARASIEALTHEYVRGERFTGVVVKLVEFGAFVRIAPGTEGLVHVSEIAPFRIERVSDFLKEGDQVPVIIKEVDERKRLSLSIKLADPMFIKPKTPPSTPPQKPEVP